MEDESDPLVSSGSSSAQKKFCFRALLIGLLASVVIGVVVGVAVGLTTRGPALPSDPLARARALMQKNILLDAHNDLPWAFRSLVKDAVFSGGLDLAAGTGKRTMTDIPKIKKGLLGGQIWSVFVDCEYANKDAVRATQEQVGVCSRGLAFS